MAESRRAALGVRGEDAAAAWYRSASYEILDRNWRCAEGEIDLVARSAEGGVLVFCEVKTRSSARFGSPFEAVTPAKQRRVRALGPVVAAPCAPDAERATSASGSTWPP